MIPFTWDGSRYAWRLTGVENAIHMTYIMLVTSKIKGIFAQFLPMVGDTLDKFLIFSYKINGLHIEINC